MGGQSQKKILFVKINNINIRTFLQQMQKRVEHKTTSRLYITTRQVRTNISLGLRARLSLMKMGKMIPFPHDWHVRKTQPPPSHLVFPPFFSRNPSI